jgi:hypothetical protein
VSENVSAAGVEARVRELAVMDWANIPSSQFRTKYGLTFQTVAAYRKREEYQETIHLLREEWKEEMLKLPSTMELRKKISLAMTLGVNTLIEILSQKNQAKDKISAARLVAQIDGRFLRETEGAEVGGTGESLAQELVNVMKKQGQTIQ